MPLYRYRCDRCGHSFSQLEPVHSMTVRRCANCGARRARRVPARVGINFKGSGFYKTNYPRRTGSAAAPSSSSSAKDGGRSSNDD